MRVTMRTCLMFAIVTVATPLWGAMPAAEQNALVKKYCAVCHTDAAKNGGLSLQHFDAAKGDPTLAAMMLSKLNSGAMGAAGNGEPTAVQQQAWRVSTEEQAAGAQQWFVAREGAAVTASIVRAVQPRHPGDTVVPLYRLRITCDGSTRTGDMQLTWSPEPQTGRSVGVSADGKPSVEYKVEGEESMGNGSAAHSGRASLQLRPPLAKQSLTIRDLFPAESVEFPFAGLDSKVHDDLQKCF